MVGVNLAAMAAHGAGKTVYLIISRPQEIQPVDIGVAQLRIVPCKASDIIPPAMADSIIGVHHVAIIPEAVPSPLLNFMNVKFLHLP